MQTFVEITAYSGIAVSFFLMLLLALKSKKKKPDFILIGWFIGVAAHCWYFYTLVSGIDYNQLARSLGSALPVLHIPVIYLYTKELVNGNSLKSWVSGLAPFIVYSLMYYLAIGNQLLYYDGLELYVSRQAPLGVRFLTPSMIIVVVVFIRLIRANVRKQERLLHENFSNDHKQTLSWINYWLISLGIGAVLIIISILIADAGWYSYQISYVLTFVFINVQMVIVGIYGLKKTPFLAGQLYVTKVPEAPKKKYEKSALSEEGLNQIKEKLLEAMETDKLYLNPDLSISDLTDHTGFSNVQISQTLNQMLGQNFFDFVNRYRVEEVKKELNNPEKNHFSILGIAMEAGFSSKSTFNKCFKKFTKTTPSSFKKNK